MVSASCTSCLDPSRLRTLRDDSSRDSCNPSSVPEGPLLLHPGTLSSVLLSKLVTGNVHQYKSDALLRQVVLTFAAAGRSAGEDDLLVAGFGNSKTDSVAYEMTGIPRHNIYVIDKTSRIRCMENRRTQQDTVDTNHTCTTTPMVQVDKVQPQQRVHWQGSAIIWIDDDDDLPKATSSLLDTSVVAAATSRHTQIVGGGASSVVLPSSSFYNGYHDPELLENVLEKMNVVQLWFTFGSGQVTVWKTV